MAAKPRVTIVGPGRLGTALILALHQAGYQIDEIVTRATPRRRNRSIALAKAVKARAISIARAQLKADVVWICVPDAAIRAAGQQLARAGTWKGKVVFHSSGALTSSELSELRKRGASVASVHPMMSFVHQATPSLAGVSFAVEGDSAAIRVAQRMVQDLRGETIRIPAGRKPLYHAFGAFTSPLLISMLAIAERVARAAGLTQEETRKALLPIVNQSLRNYEKQGPAGALSGPIIRGDVETVRKHLVSLKPLPEAQQAYIALARAGLRLLPARHRKQLLQALEAASHVTRSAAPQSGRGGRRGSRAPGR